MTERISGATQEELERQRVNIIDTLVDYCVDQDLSPENEDRIISQINAIRMASRLDELDRIMEGRVQHSFLIKNYVDKLREQLIQAFYNPRK